MLENNHSVLFYEDYEKALNIELSFLKKGLEDGEGAIYATTEDPRFITFKMEEFEIDVQGYSRRNQLNICYVPSPFSHPNSPVEGVRETLGRFLSNLKKPVRGVGRAVPEINTFEGISLEMQIEHIFHSSFNEFPGSFMCSFPIAKINSDKFADFIVAELENHDSAIFAPKFGDPAVLNL